MVLVHYHQCITIRRSDIVCIVGLTFRTTSSVLHARVVVPFHFGQWHGLVAKSTVKSRQHHFTCAAKNPPASERERDQLRHHVLLVHYSWSVAVVVIPSAVDDPRHRDSVSICKKDRQDSHPKGLQSEMDRGHVSRPRPLMHCYDWWHFLDRPRDRLFL